MIYDLERELDLGWYKKAYCNLHVKDERVEYIDLSKRPYYKELSELRADNHDGVPTALLCLDQVHKYAPAHRTNATLTVRFVNILVEMRQHGLDLRWDTWARSSVVNRVRKFTPLTIDCYRIGPRPPSLPKGFRYQPIDSENGPLRQEKMSLEQAQKAWKLFDTNEIARSPEEGEMEGEDSSGGSRVDEPTEELLAKVMGHGR